MNFFEQIKEIPNWVCWDFEAYKAWDEKALKRWEALSSEDKIKFPFTKKNIKNPHKKPLQINGYGASSTDPKTWTTYDRISNKYSAGFVLSENNSIITVDLDHCRNKETGELTDYAIYVLKLFASGTEISQSKEGLHIFGYGKVPCAIKTKEIEVYGTERYICITGNILLDLPLMNIQRALNIIYSTHKEKQKYKKRNIKIEKVVPISSSELDELLKIERFRKLWGMEIEFIKDGGGFDFSRYDFNIALALKNEKPEQVLGVLQEFRRINGFPKKHLGALHNAIQKTSIWKK